MQGQWIGGYQGSNNGLILVDCDRVGDHYEGYAFVTDAKPGSPDSFVEFVTPDLSPKFVMQLPVKVIDPSTAEPGDWNRIAQNFPGFTFPAHAVVQFELHGGKLKIEWHTNIQTFGSALLEPSQASQLPVIQPLPNVSNWLQFREFVREFKFKPSESFVDSRIAAGACARDFIGRGELA